MHSAKLKSFNLPTNCHSSGHISTDSLLLSVLSYFPIFAAIVEGLKIIFFVSLIDFIPVLVKRIQNS